MATKKASKTAKKATKPPSRRPAPKTAGAADAIRRLDATFMKAISAKNAGALVRAFYAPDAVLMPPNHPSVEGHAGIQGFLQGLIDSGLSRIVLETTSVASVGDLAYGRGRYTLTLAPAAGTPGQDTGKYIVVYRRAPGGPWRAVADIFNSDQAAT